jgi:hypothetical protein
VRRLACAILGALALLVGTAVAGAPPASASTSGYCPTSKGVTVVADFTALGGGVEIHCDATASSSTSGLSALQAVFSVEGTQHDGPAFVCRINHQPTLNQDPCINTPPANKYWSYWYASNGGSWSYSSVGASSRHVIVGGFEGWRFGDGSNSPRATPTRPPAPPVPTYKIGPAATAHAAPTSSSHSTTSSASRTSSPTTTATATATATPTTSTTPATPDGTATSAGSQAGATLPGGDPPPGGSPWPFVGALVAVALIGGGAGLVVVRRRRAGA